MTLRIPLRAYVLVLLGCVVLLPGGALADATAPGLSIAADLLMAGVLVIALLLGVLIASYMSARRKARRLEEMSQKAHASRLLVDAMNAVHSAIVVYDKDLRAVHWNDGFASAFPKLMPLIESHGSLQEVLLHSSEAGLVSGAPKSSEARALANEVAEKLRRGETITRVIRGGTGRIFEATELPLGNGFFASLRVDVTRPLEQAAVIENQKAELEAANDKLQIFATIAAHDLKAPLLQQSSLLQLIEEDLDDMGQALPEEVLGYFAMLDTLSARMRHLIEGLLDHAQAGEESMGAEPLNVSERMPSIVDMVGLPDGFEIEIQPDLPSVRVVPASFDAVMRNLISNAVNHHDRSTGVIKIRGAQIGDQTVFEVEDDGPGIPEEHRSSIFDPFKRLSVAVEGSGLGLSFIKKTVNQWGGGIYVESRKERGSIFVFSVPSTCVTDLFFAPNASLENMALH